MIGIMCQLSVCILVVLIMFKNRIDNYLVRACYTYIDTCRLSMIQRLPCLYIHLSCCLYGNIVKACSIFIKTEWLKSTSYCDQFCENRSAQTTHWCCCVNVNSRTNLGVWLDADKKAESRCSAVFNSEIVGLPKTAIESYVIWHLNRKLCINLSLADLNVATHSSTDPHWRENNGFRDSITERRIWHIAEWHRNLSIRAGCLGQIVCTITIRALSADW